MAAALTINTDLAMRPGLVVDTAVEEAISLVPLSDSLLDAEFTQAVLNHRRRSRRLSIRPDSAEYPVFSFRANQPRPIAAPHHDDYYGCSPISAAGDKLDSPSTPAASPSEEANHQLLGSGAPIHPCGICGSTQSVDGKKHVWRCQHCLIMDEAAGMNSDWGFSSPSSSSPQNTSLGGSSSPTARRASSASSSSP